MTIGRALGFIFLFQIGVSLILILMGVMGIGMNILSSILAVAAFWIVSLSFFALGVWLGMESGEKIGARVIERIWLRRMLSFRSN